MAFQNGAMIVPPFGGTTGLFSTNPFSYAVPAGRHPDRRLRHRHHRGGREQDPPGPQARRRDRSPRDGRTTSDGRPTTDPNAASISQLQWFGGHKGFGIGLLVEIMAGVLADSSFGATEHSESELHRLGPRRQGRDLRGPRRRRGSCRSTTSVRTSTSSSTTCTHRHSPRAPNASSFRASSKPSGARDRHAATASLSPPRSSTSSTPSAASLDCPPLDQEPGVDIPHERPLRTHRPSPPSSHDGGVLVATLNRPEHRNSLDPVMHLELQAALRAASSTTRSSTRSCSRAPASTSASAPTSTTWRRTSATPTATPGCSIESVGMARNILAVRVPDDRGDQRRRHRHRRHHLAVLRRRATWPTTRGSPTRTCAPAMVAGDGGAVLWPLLMGPTGPRST